MIYSTDAGTWFAATRPQFLTAIVLPVALGSALAAWQQGFVLPGALLLALLAAVCAHAGANLLNDYYDHLSGADALNGTPLRPFAGGSRVIQRGLLRPAQVRGFGVFLLVVAVLIGLYLLVRSGLPLLLIGAVGLALGFAYTAPPWALCYRGLGELAVFLAFGPLAVAGAYVVQTGRLDPVVLAPGTAIGLLAAAILYVNQFPDHATDRAAGKRTLVVRLGPERAARYAAGWSLLAGLVLLAGALTPSLPGWLVIGLAPTGFAALAASRIPSDPADHDRLVPVIQSTIGAHAALGLLLSTGFAIEAWLGR